MGRTISSGLRGLNLACSSPGGVSWAVPDPHLKEDQGHHHEEESLVVLLLVNFLIIIPGINCLTYDISSCWIS